MVARADDVEVELAAVERFISQHARN